ncbi:MAG: phosphotransferase [Proteobacteria bacterium]|nr:phosphotransferase [Pseudomonadota bacterium]
MSSKGQSNSGIVLSNWNLMAEASPTTSARVTRLRTPSDFFYLKSSASTESVERDLELLDYLDGAGLPVPRCVTTMSGARYAVDEGRAFWVSHGLPGDHFAQFRGPTGVEQVERLAMCLGEVHRVLADAPDPQRFPVFRDSADQMLANLLARATPFDVNRLQQLRSQVASLATLQKQLIHRDFHRGNVLFTDGVVTGILDFDLVHQGPRLFDVCYCASGVLSESFRETGYAEYWLEILATVFRAYGRSVRLSAHERALAWSMLITIELIFMTSCLDSQVLDAALMNEGMLFWFEDHRGEIEAAIAGGYLRA